MKQVADVMTDDVFAVEPQETLRRAAELMAKLGPDRQRHQRKRR